MILLIGLYRAGVKGYWSLKMESLKLFGIIHSSLLSASGSTSNDVRTGGLCWGEDGTLWVTNALSNLPLHRFNPITQQWKAFSLGAFNGLSVKDIIQGSDGVFWIQSRTNGLMAVKTQDNTVDLRRLTTGVGNGNLPLSLIHI